MLPLEDILLIKSLRIIFFCIMQCFLGTLMTESGGGKLIPCHEARQFGRYSLNIVRIYIVHILQKAWRPIYQIKKQHMWKVCCPNKVFVNGHVKISVKLGNGAHLFYYYRTQLQKFYSVYLLKIIFQMKPLSWLLHEFIQQLRWTW